MDFILITKTLVGSRFSELFGKIISWSLSHQPGVWHLVTYPRASESTLSRWSCTLSPYHIPSNS